MIKQYTQKIFRKIDKNSPLLFLFILLGLSIRLYNLGSHNLWFDEVATSSTLNFYFEKLNPHKFFILMKLPNHHLYYILLKPWTIFFGKSEFALRSLSMVFGALSILLIYKLGKLFFNTRVGLISSFILSVSPIHIWYSQEARGYCLSTFLVMAVVYLFSLAAEKNRLNLWVSFIVSSILAIYSNYFCIYAIIIISIFIFQEKYRRLFKKWLVSLCFISIAFLPQVPNFIKSMVSIENHFWIPKPHLSSIVTTLENFNVGYNATANVYFFSFIVFSLLYILGIKSWWPEKKETLLCLNLLVFFPIISSFLISQITPVYLDRQLMLFSSLYYIIIAAGLSKIKMNISKFLIYVFILSTSALCIYNYLSYYLPVGLYHHIGVHVKKPVKPAADYIKKNFMKGDIIGFSEPSSFSLSYYLRKFIIKKKIGVISFVIKSKLDPYWKKKGERTKYGLYFPGISSRIAIKVAILDEEKSSKKFEERNFKRLWLILSSWARDGNLDPHAKAVREWMRTHYSIIETREFDGIFIDIYCPKSNLM